MNVFRVDETHGRAVRAGNRLIANSQDAGWRSLHAAIIEEGPFEATEPAIGHPMLIYHLTRPTEVARKIEGGPGNRFAFSFCSETGGSRRALRSAHEARRVVVRRVAIDAVNVARAAAGPRPL